MERHAYLLIANENQAQLIRLLEMLDHPDNAIFLHWDRKSPALWEGVYASVKRAALHVLPEPLDVGWGNFSQVECELKLLRYAVEQGPFFYYHLMSGKDLPLKSQEEIHRFFHDHAGKEFVRIGKHEEKEFRFRYRYYYRQKNLRGTWGKLSLVARALTQKLAGVDRTRENPHIRFQKGTQWFSVTQSLAEFVLSKEDWIRRTFCYTYCPDEVFLQTLVHNSPFQEKLYRQSYDGDCRSNMRLIDWKRGNPYVFRREDAQELQTSPCLFARKFDEKTDPQIIELLHDRVCQE